MNNDNRFVFHAAVFIFFKIPLAGFNFTPLKFHKDIWCGAYLISPIEIKLFAHSFFASLRLFLWIDRIRPLFRVKVLLILQYSLFIKFLCPLGRIKILCIKGNWSHVLILAKVFFRCRLPILIFYYLIIGKKNVLLKRCYVLSVCWSITESGIFSWELIKCNFILISIFGAFIAWKLDVIVCISSPRILVITCCNCCY